MRVGRTDGRLDYVCIWNTHDPECVHIEFAAGRGAQWKIDRPSIVKGFKYISYERRGKEYKLNVRERSN